MLRPWCEQASRTQTSSTTRTLRTPPGKTLQSGGRQSTRARTTPLSPVFSQPKPTKSRCRSVELRRVITLWTHPPLIQEAQQGWAAHQGLSGKRAPTTTMKKNQNDAPITRTQISLAILQGISGPAIKFPLRATRLSRARARRSASNALSRER